MRQQVDINALIASMPLSDRPMVRQMIGPLVSAVTEGPIVMPKGKDDDQGQG